MPEAPAKARKGQSLWRDAWRRLRRNRFAMAGLVVVVLMSLAAIFAALLMPFDADYGQPWVGDRPPGHEHPAVIAETRFDAGEAPVVPERIPDAVADLLTRDGTIEYLVHEKEETDYLVKVRAGRVERIQLKQGALTLPRIEAAGEGERLEVVGEDGKPQTTLRGVAIETRQPLPETLPGAKEPGARALLLRLVKPRTPAPETIRVAIRGGKVAGIERGGGSVASLRLDARDVLDVRKEGRRVTLHHLLGTDTLGRDVLTRVLFGGRISLMVGVVATLVSVLIGVVYGAVAGYLSMQRMGALGVVGALLGIAAAVAALGAISPKLYALAAGLLALGAVPWAVGRLGRFLPERLWARPVTTTGEFMMRIVDILYALPFMFLVILLMVAFGRDLIVLFVALGAVEWLTMSRIVRGQVLSLKEKEFVEAARMCGASDFAILFRHLIPNTLGIVVVYATLTVPAVILTESFLAFIGLNVEYQGRALDSWGALVNQGRLALTEDGGRWWILLWPSLAMTVTLLSLNFLGDGLRDAFDPKLKGKR